VSSRELRIRARHFKGPGLHAGEGDQLVDRIPRMQPIVETPRSIAVAVGAGSNRGYFPPAS
jgi:hypothetical protein